jgi:hypothetical protein
MLSSVAPFLLSLTPSRILAPLPSAVASRVNRKPRFSGSGSTTLAATLSGRRYLGIDLEPEYCQLARKRLAGACRYMSREAAA